MTKPRLPSFHIVNLGCKVNRVEADTMAACLLAAGAVGSALSRADVVLINTCTVTCGADAKSRKEVRRAAKYAPRWATIIICGCGAVTVPREFKKGIIGRGETRVKRYGYPACIIEIIPQKPAALTRAGEVLGLAIPECAFDDAVVRVGKGFPTRVAIKIQDGCDHACSYCIVPLARGRAQSLPLTQALEQIAAQVQAGAREVILTGIDLGSYQDGAYGLEHLLGRALEVAEGFRLRLSSIELPSITDGLIQLIAASEGRICAHLHIPLQSGSDSVLKAMGRRYDRAAYSSRIAAIRETLPQVALTTDAIVGFPGETHEDFQQTLALCREMGFCHIHVFRYSKRPGTRAAGLPDQVPAQLMVKRASKLRALAKQLRCEDAQRRVGSREAVVYERRQEGRSESYYPVRMARRAHRGDLVTMEITGYEDGMLTVSKPYCQLGTKSLC
ncbi:MAG: MiaB/RimO family radical SAM methylthiotransferase [Coriobacteriales bacterium]|jgi:threonylcarbamoyladenosine tRNA methylthiotransferase MtaB|nr:MiaB/RimO family radical SAM methylthiotransferase [Coriobacteriales bacterium]